MQGSCRLFSWQQDCHCLAWLSLPRNSSFLNVTYNAARYLELSRNPGEGKGRPHSPGMAFFQRPPRPGRFTEPYVKMVGLPIRSPAYESMNSSVLLPFSFQPSGVGGSCGGNQGKRLVCMVSEKQNCCVALGRARHRSESLHHLLCGFLCPNLFKRWSGCVLPAEEPKGLALSTLGSASLDFAFLA